MDDPGVPGTFLRPCCMLPKERSAPLVQDCRYFMDRTALPRNVDLAALLCEVNPFLDGTSGFWRTVGM